MLKKAVALAEELDAKGDPALQQAVAEIMAVPVKRAPLRAPRQQRATPPQIHAHLLRAFAMYPLDVPDRREVVSKTAYDSLQEAHLYAPIDYLRDRYSNDSRYKDLVLYRAPRKKSRGKRS